ncbi:hypothetical protein [Actinoplanes utahensis]|nr:hypothetical protein [Actinoplanes utahensis]
MTEPGHHPSPHAHPSSAPRTRRSRPDNVVAGVAVAVLGVWLAFRLFLALLALLVSGNCDGGDSDFCSVPGRILGPWGAPLAAAAGIALIVYGAWIRRRHPVLIWVAAAALVALLGHVVAGHYLESAPGV